MNTANLRTDMALELAEGNTNLLSEEKKLEHDVVVHTVKIKNEEQAQSINKPIGTYITLTAEQSLGRDLDVQKYVAEQFSICLSGMIDELIPFKKNAPILIVGLGNAGMTADALGNKTCLKTIVTRHVYEIVSSELDSRLASVCAISPNVLGVTGVETFDIISGVVERVKPQLVIVIDSLASQKTSRIACTFQMSNTGVTPGAGVGNFRHALSKETLGVPVIAIGVPLVVYAKTIASEALLGTGADEMQVRLISNDILTELLGDLVVTPKDIDVVVSDCAFILSIAINKALHRDLSIDDIVSYAH